MKPDGYRGTRDWIAKDCAPGIVISKRKGSIRRALGDEKANIVLALEAAAV